MEYKTFDADKFFVACILVLVLFPVSAFIIATIIMFSSGVLK